MDTEQKALSDWDLQELRKCEREKTKLLDELKILDAKIDVWESGLQARAAFITFETEESCLYIKDIYANDFNSCCPGV